MSTHKPFPRLAMAIAFALLVGACGSSSDGSATTSGSTTTTALNTTTEATTSSTAETTTSIETTTAAETTTSTETWRGQQVDLFAKPGDVLAVVGVEHDDELNVRAGPGTEHAVVTQVGPADSVIAAGRVWHIVGESFWNEVDADGTTGWVNLRFLAYAGGVDDATSEIVAELGAIPEAETMLELGLIAAQPFVTDDPPTRIVLSVAPTVGDIGEVTYDLIGFGDDSLLGFRLHVFGQPSDSGEGFFLGSVERTLLCARGLSGELCT